MDIRSLGIVVVWFVFVTFGTILLDRYVSTKWALVACLLAIGLLVWLYYESILQWAPSHKSWFLMVCAVVGIFVAVMGGELFLKLARTATTQTHNPPQRPVPSPESSVRPESPLSSGSIDVPRQAKDHRAGEGFMQIYPTVKDSATLLKENQKIVFVANYINKGLEPVKSFLPFASLLPIGNFTEVPKISTANVWKKFHQQAKEYKHQHPHLKGDSVGPGDNWQVTVDSIQAMNKPLLDAIQSGETKLLLVARAEWTTVNGIKGEIESCFVLNPPQENNPLQLTWSSCDSL